MVKVTNLKNTDNVDPLILRAYISKKIAALMEEYNVGTLDDIGCFIVLENDEFSEFPMNEMEFVEVLEIGRKKNYLHGVRIISDSYGEEYFLPIEVRET